MKKLAIAGASVALAAMPIVSTFATTTITDHLTVTVDETCELGTIEPGQGTGGNENYYWATANPGDSAVPFFAGDNQGDTTSGEDTSIVINCNSASGYKITPSFQPLHRQGDAATTNDIAYGGAATPVAGTYTAYYALGSGSATEIGPSDIITGQPTVTDTYTFSYKVSPAAAQAAGTYKGDAVYTLAANS